MDADQQPQNDNWTIIRRLLTTILVLLTVFAIFFAKDMLFPVVLGVVLALTLSPVVRAAARRGAPPPLTAVVLIVSLGAVGSVGIYTMSGPISEWAEQVPNLGYKVRARLDKVLESVEAAKTTAKEVEDIANGDNANGENEVVVKEAGFVSMALNRLANTGGSLAVALVLAMFLLSSGDLLRNKMIHAAGDRISKDKAKRIIADVETRISRYLFTITLINAGLGLAVAVSLFIIGLPYAFLWGVLIFGLNFLPFIGTVIGTALVAAVSIVTFDDLGYALLSPGAYLALGALEGQVVTPMILGRRLEINTVSVFLTVIFWAWLWGLAGALLAVPILVIAKVICENVDGLNVVAYFLSADNPRDPATRRRRSLLAPPENPAE